MSRLNLCVEWAALSPVECEAWIQRSQGMSPRAAQAELLLTVIEAIAARPEWGFNLCQARHVIFGTPAYFGVIDKGDGVEHENAELGDPAIALLAGYLAALRSETAIAPGDNP